MAKIVQAKDAPDFFNIELDSGELWEDEAGKPRVFSDINAAQRQFLEPLPAANPHKKEVSGDATLGKAK